MSSPKFLGLIVAAALLLWAGGAYYLQNEISKTEKEYLKRNEVLARYEALKALWSEDAAKKALKQTETLFRMYGIQPKVEKKRGRSYYTFTVTATQADKVLGKFLNSGIRIGEFSAKKVSDDILEIRVEVLR